jgi:hypothetical protein
MNQLTFRYEYNDHFDPQRDDLEEAGRLTVLVVTARFSGIGTFEAPPQSVREFGKSLSTFPITSGKPLGVSWGYSGRMSSVVISAANATGTLLVSVEIEDDLSVPLDERVSEGVRTSFVTDYVQIDAFRRSVANLMDGKVDEAILRGH